MPTSKNDASAGRFLHTAWCQELRDAATKLRISREQLAVETKFSKAKVQNIMGGHERASMDDLVKLAEALQVPKLRILALAGYLDGVTNLLNYMEQLEELVDRTTQASAELPFDQAAGTAQIASAALADGRFIVTLRPVWAGSGPRQSHYRDSVVLRFADGRPMTADAVEQVERRLRSRLTWFCAGIDSGWVDSLELVISIPRLNMPRRSSGQPIPGLPRSVAVIGGHWSGQHDVASLLGYGLDYDFAFVGHIASRAFSRLANEREISYLQRDHIEVTRTYVEGSEIGRHRVWSADVGDSSEAASVLATSRHRDSPLVIYLRASDELLDWAARARADWRYRAGEVSDLIRLHNDARDRVDKIVQDSLRVKAITLDVFMPDPSPVGPDGRPVVDDDAWFDIWFGLAEEAIEKMSEMRKLRADWDLARRRLHDKGLRN